MFTCLRCFVLLLSILTSTMGYTMDEQVVVYGDNLISLIESVSDAMEVEQINPSIDNTNENDISNPDNIAAPNGQLEDTIVVDTMPTQKDVIFTDVDEYLYVGINNLNVRVGPGTEYDKMESIPLNTKVHRIGRGDNGWSKIDYNGQIAYVFSDYLSDQKTHVETVEEEIVRRGNIGRLTIPSIGVNVALFKHDVNVNSQHIVDAKDSAAYLTGQAQIIIADHANQGFSTIKSSVPGQTRAHIDFGSYTKNYICVKKFVGCNARSDLVDLDGNSILNQNQGGVCIYTCNSDDTITITYWQPTQ